MSGVCPCTRRGPFGYHRKDHLGRWMDHYDWYCKPQHERNIPPMDNFKSGFETWDLRSAERALPEFFTKLEEAGCVDTDIRSMTKDQAHFFLMTAVGAFRNAADAEANEAEEIPFP